MPLGIHPMRESFFRNSFLLLALWAALQPSRALAEFACSADVSYTWVKSPADSGHPDAVDHQATSETPAGRGGGRQGADSQAVKPNTPPPEPKPAVVRFASVQRAGLDEAGAKANLQVELQRQKVRASEQCKRDHESIGDCMATKLSSRASTLNSLGFSARAELEKALTRECSGQQGVCLSVDSTEPQCRQYGSGKAGDQAAADKKSPAKKPETKKK